MWSHKSIFYQIYPLGFCGAPKENDGKTVNRIKKVIEWTDYLSELGIDTVDDEEEDSIMLLRRDI